MRTVRECLLKAQDCDNLADACFDVATRDMMLETAQHWRALAASAATAGEVHLVEPQVAESSPVKPTEADRRAPLEAWLRVVERTRRIP